jgi:Reverse transcriptase (RNA-dependent DNA polymerase)
MMSTDTAIEMHRRQTKALARSLMPNEVYFWLLKQGYFPESYVLPPCFKVSSIPNAAKLYFKVPTKKDKKFLPTRTECVRVHFPKSELTDRTFGVMDPHIHNDIAFHLSRNWKKVVDTLIPDDSIVTAYSFPIPLTRKAPGRLGNLRSGRMIYEFIDMTDDDLVSVAYRYTHIVKADIKNFYPSIYTHSLAWALHGKTFVRKPKNMHDSSLLGNRLDKLFQNASDGCTNGLPIGPVVSDLAAEMVAASVDRELTRQIRSLKIDCAAVRFKDDYRILVKSDHDARSVIKALQTSLKEFNLELSDEKTKVALLPTGLFREWVSRYHAIHPVKREKFNWKQFRELYLGVLEIDRACPGTGVIDRFLADIVSDDGRFKLDLEARTLERAVSMLVMLGALRIKAFPKIMAIIESVIKSSFGAKHEPVILHYLEEFLHRIASEEDRNKYLISWLLYFLVSNDFYSRLKKKPTLKDPITRSVASNRATVFSKSADFKLFMGCKSAGRAASMLKHLDLFNPPELT